MLDTQLVSQRNFDYCVLLKFSLQSVNPQGVVTLNRMPGTVITLTLTSKKHHKYLLRFTLNFITYVSSFLIIFSCYVTFIMLIVFRVSIRVRFVGQCDIFHLQYILFYYYILFLLAQPVVHGSCSERNKSKIVPYVIL